MKNLVHSPFPLRLVQPFWVPFCFCGLAVRQVGFLGVIGIIILGRVVTNISMVPYKAENRNNVIMKYSANADLTIIGFSTEVLKNIEEFSQGYNDWGNILFVSSNRAKAIN